MELHIPFRSQHRLPCASLLDTFSFSLPVIFGAKFYFAQFITYTVRFKPIHSENLFFYSINAILHEEKMRLKPEALRNNASYRYNCCGGRQKIRSLCHFVWPWKNLLMAGTFNS
jgi:hypothetical protein